MKRAVILFLAACNSFEPEEIVIDTRVLAMAADVPDQVVDVELDPTTGQPNTADLLDQLVPSTMCALVADPVEDRRLHATMTLCLQCDAGCCDTPRTPLFEGVIEDPELAIPEPQLCATVQPDGNLLGTILAALDGDILGGVAGIDYIVELRVGPETDDRDLDQVSSKTLRVAPRFPEGRAPNHNPSIDHFEAARYRPDGERDEPITMPMGRCVDQTAPLELVPTQKVRIEPIEPPDARETYVVPTIDGQGETFTESWTYQWLATAGSVSAGSTGGPRDAATGNPAPLFTEFRAPGGDDLVLPMDIQLWIVQRDERLGAVWYESCVRVVPEQ